MIKIEFGLHRNHCLVHSKNSRNKVQKERGKDKQPKKQDGHIIYYFQKDNAYFQLHLAAGVILALLANCLFHAQSFFV